MRSSEFYEIVNGLVLAANVLAEGNNDPKVKEYKDKVTQLANFVNEKRAGDAGFQVADLQQLVAYLGETHVALNALKDKGVSEKMMKNTAEQLKLIEQTVALMDVTMNLPLTQVVDETSISNYELQGEAKKAGANSSSRSMIVARDVNKESVDGFFTPEEKAFDDQVDKRISIIANEMLRKYSDNQELRDFIEELNSKTYGRYTLISCMSNEIDKIHSEDTDPKSIPIEHAYNKDRLHSRGIISKYQFDRMKDNVGIKEFMVRARREFTMNEISKFGTQHVQYGPLTGRGIQAEVGSSISGRNVAVSNVANILGVPNLVAKSVPATVKEDGKDVKGVFMKKAVGLDYPRKVEDLMNSDFMLLKGQGFSGEGLKQLADLQVLDYLCQYVDRHQSNLLYTIKDGAIDGIQAIDNDTSFGTLDPKHNEAVQNGSALYDISVISESMKRSIMNLQPETFVAAISDLGLTDAEIKAAKNRLEYLKEYIVKAENTKDKLEAGTVKVIKDEEWKDMNIKDLSNARLLDRVKYDNKKGSNIFSRTKHVAGNAIAVRRHMYGEDDEAAIKEYLEEKELKQSFKRKRKSKYTGTVLLDELSPDELNNKRDSFEQYHKDMVEAENSQMRKNPAYTEMKNALKGVLEFKHEKAMDYNERVRYDNALLKLRDASKSYVNDCIQNGISKKEVKAQLETAKELCEFTEQHESIFHQASLDRQEAEQNEVYNKLQMEQKQFDQIVDVLSEKLSKQMQGVDKAKVADRIKSGSVLRAMLNERVAENDGKLRDNYKHYADMAATKPKELVDTFIGRVRQNAIDVERKQSINYRTVNKFDKHLQNLNNAKTKRNSKEYEAIITAVDLMNKKEKIEVGVDLNEKQLYAVKLLAIKSSINDYIEHKAKSGVNKSIGDKLAVIEKLNKEVSQTLEDIRDEVEPFTLNGKKVDLSKLPITKAEEVEKAKAANPKERIPEEREMQNATDDCMQRIITKAIQKKYSTSHIKDLNKMRNVLNDIEIAKPAQMGGPRK